MEEVRLHSLFISLYIEVRVIVKERNIDHLVTLPPYVWRESKRVYDRVGTSLRLKPSFVKL